MILLGKADPTVYYQLYYPIVSFPNLIGIVGKSVKLGGTELTRMIVRFIGPLQLVAILLPAAVLYAMMVMDSYPFGTVSPK